jgi:hypothetical protein
VTEWARLTGEVQWNATNSSTRGHGREVAVSEFVQALSEFVQALSEFSPLAVSKFVQ